MIEIDREQRVYQRRHFLWLWRNLQILFFKALAGLVGLFQNGYALFGVVVLISGVSVAVVAAITPPPARSAPAPSHFTAPAQDDHSDPGPK